MHHSGLNLYDAQLLKIANFLLLSHLESFFHIMKQSFVITAPQTVRVGWEIAGQMCQVFTYAFFRQCGEMPGILYILGKQGNAM